MTDSPPSSNGAALAHNNNGNPPVCQNCGTSTTPLWRRNELGATLCNACGLFLKLHGRARPLNLKTDTIKSRNRVKSVTQPKRKMVFDDHKGHNPHPRPGLKHMNGQSNGYPNGHMRIEQHPKSRMDMSRQPYDHHESSYSSQAYSYARSNASSTESGNEYSPPSGPISEPPKPYSPYYGAIGSPRDYTRGPHSPPYYPVHPHHSLGGPPPLSLPPTSHSDGSRSLPPPASLLRPSPPPRHDSPQLPPIYAMEAQRHLAPHHPHSPLVPAKRDPPSPGPSLAEQFESLKQSNEHLRGRVMELELVNDLMKSRVSELESSEQKARSTIEGLKSDISQYQTRENDLYRKIDKLQDELVGAYKTRHSRSPSNSSRSGGDEESAAKRRKVSLSELVEAKKQQTAQQSPSPISNGDIKPE
jgi:hypothetical protein